MQLTYEIFVPGVQIRQPAEAARFVSTGLRTACKVAHYVITGLRIAWKSYALCHKGIDALHGRRDA
eukprot:2810742-Rhodomonas_salina.1